MRHLYVVLDTSNLSLWEKVKPRRALGLEYACTAADVHSNPGPMRALGVGVVSGAPDSYDNSSPCASPHETAPALTLGTLNVCGFGNDGKRQELAVHAERMNCDVIVLTGTRLVTPAARSRVNGPGGTAFDLWWTAGQKMAGVGDHVPGRHCGRDSRQVGN